MEALIAYCLETYPGTLPPDDAPGREEPAVILLHQVVERMADLAASYMTAGLVHGVLNTDNMNISGESFDYGPWRWLPAWDATFTAAYFDHSGLYAFGRQPEAIHWNCGQLAIALRMVTDSDPLVAALGRFGPLYRQAMARRFIWRLGLESRGEDADVALITAAEKHMRETGIGPDVFFFAHRGGRGSAEGEFGELLGTYRPSGDDAHPLWREPSAPSLVIEEVERVWDAIDKQDDWGPLNQKVADIRVLGEALQASSSPPR